MREHFNIAASERSEDDAGALRQVSVDVPRTAPGVAFFHQEPVQRSLERILYIWGIRWAPRSLSFCRSSARWRQGHTGIETRMAVTVYY